MPFQRQRDSTDFALLTSSLLGRDIFDSFCPSREILDQLNDEEIPGKPHLPDLIRLVCAQEQLSRFLYADSDDFLGL